jgi:hypothetical protein
MNRSTPTLPLTARSLLAFATLAVALVLTACSPTTTPPASAPDVPASLEPASSTEITSADAAAALVLASDSRFANLAPKNPDLIGQCCFYEVTPSADGWEVKIEIGWGDCQAGCIDRHHWFYAVDRKGDVRLDREDGSPLPPGVPAAAGGTGTLGDGVAGITGTAVAGPTCPVVTPNDPSCADRPVAGATIRIVDATGLEVATLTTDADGGFSVALPPGTYQVRADPSVGTMAAPAPVDVVVDRSAELVQLTYDTGIR